MSPFGPSKTELEERIHELESEDKETKATAENNKLRIDDIEGSFQFLRERVATLESDINRLEDEAEENARAAAKLAEAMQNVAIESFPTIEYDPISVETLDEPHVAWKATRNNIVRLVIPEGATVVHPEDQGRTHPKLRCSEAIVLTLYDAHENSSWVGPNPHDETDRTEVSLSTTDESMHAYEFEYEVGELVRPDESLDTDTFTECASGIHFFPSEEGAKDWYMM